MEMVEPIFGPAMSNLVEDKALDMVEEENFKEWLVEQGDAPESINAMPSDQAVEKLDSLFATWVQDGGRDAA